jgi:hypothetical protein
LQFQCLAVGIWSHLLSQKIKINKEPKGQYLQNTGATEGSDKTFFQKIPIYWVVEKFFTLQILQPVRVI